MKILRVYPDTSVFGGCFDKEYAEHSRRLFQEATQGRFILAVSGLTAEELGAAPERVRSVLDELPETCLEFHEIDAEMEALRDSYLEANVLGPASEADALHVAAATVLGVDLLVSWNYKHIVHFEKIRGFDAVSRMNGYRSIEIYSPMEVVSE